MNSPQIFHLLRCYLEMGLLLIFGFLALFMLNQLMLKLKIKPNYSHLVKIGYLVLLSSIGLPIALQSLPRSTLFRPAAQVWSAPEGSTLSTPYYLELSQTQTNSTDITNSSKMAFSKALLLGSTGIVSGIVVLLVLLFLMRVLIFHRSLSSLPIIRRIGRTTILASDLYPVAFSTWSLKGAIVVVPVKCLSNYKDFRIVVHHEIQHHRHGDTRWLYFIEFMKALFFWNPGIYGLSKWLSALQEFACDDFVVHHRNLSLQDYGNCLVRAAESTVRSQVTPIGVAGMAANNDSSLLKRRIELILSHRSPRPTKAATSFVAVILFTILTSIAYAAKSTVQDKTISLDEAKKYEVIAAKTARIPVTVNDLVLGKLNHFIGTPEGRRWTKEALAKMPQYRQMILSKISSHDLPEELIAIPFFESGFKNLPPTPPQKGAGIWEFIAETAKRYKLQVSERPAKIDERLDPDKETDAAIQYLTDLNRRFKDWRLAIKAYNEGENHVQSLIDQFHTRDPWVLESKRSPDGYLSGVMAMIIILKNPSLLN